MSNVSILSVFNSEKVIELVNTFKDHVDFAVEFETTDSSVGNSCQYCNGTGERECYACEGSGRVDHGYRDESSDEWVYTHRDECPVCEGSREIDCDDCSGDVADDLEYDWDEIKSDCTCGMEMVTGRMSWDRWNTWRDEISHDIRSYVSTSSMTGGHTHIDWSWIRNNMEDHSRIIRNTVTLAYFMNDHVQELLGTNERRRRNGYCDKFSDYHMDSKNPEVFQRAYDEDMAIWNYSSRGWFYTGNVKNSTDEYKNTIEFRVFDSTDSVKKAEENIAYAQAWMIYSMLVEDMDQHIAELMTDIDDRETACTVLHTQIVDLSKLLLAHTLEDLYTYDYPAGSQEELSL